LEFDQLNAIMKKGAFFDGFREGPINFPPTFKYDVSRPVKRRKRSRPEDQSPLSLTGDRQAELAEDDVDDVVSLTSSVTTVNSRGISEAGLVDDYFRAVPSSSTIASSNSKKLDGFTGRKWLSLLSPSFATSPKFAKFQSSEPRQMSSLTPTTPNAVLSISPQFPTTPKTANPIKKRFLRPPPLISANFSASQSSIQDEIVDDGKGVYDTSSKKRVPSWLVVEHHPSLGN
jgi:hypothetical protein